MYINRGLDLESTIPRATAATSEKPFPDTMSVLMPPFTRDAPILPNAHSHAVNSRTLSGHDRHAAI